MSTPADRTAAARRRHAPAWFVRWYMGRVAGRYCPCEWPVKSKRLIRWCAWIDDEYDRLDFIRFIGFHMGQQNVATASSSNVKVTWRRRRHGE